MALRFVRLGTLAAHLMIAFVIRLLITGPIGIYKMKIGYTLRSVPAIEIYMTEMSMAGIGDHHLTLLN
jgi:hypothetical protein